MKSIQIILIFLNSFSAISNSTDSTNNRLKIFFDCQNTWCDMTFINSEITIIDFLRDRTAADVHVLLTSRQSGSGGQAYQFIFYGQNKFLNQTDTITFFTSPTATEVESRDVLIRNLKKGLFPYIVQTGSFDLMDLTMKNDSATTINSTKDLEKDKWNFWVIRTGVNGSFNTDQNYRSYDGYVSSNIFRTTEKLKVDFNFYGGTRSSTYFFGELDGQEQSVTVKNSEYGFSHMLCKTITDHFSLGYSTRFNNSSFANNKANVTLAPMIEYNIFPYKDVNSKSFTIGYMPGIRYNIYYDTTIYNKTEEFLTGHAVFLNISFNQKWGNCSFGAQYSNYFHDWNLNRLTVNASINLRIAGNLFIDFYTYAGLTHDQVNVAKGDIAAEDILTRRRQLQSGFNIYSNLGISYRFGSKLNNVVNPRFDSMY